MSLRDSGTKSKKFLRVLAVFATVAVLLVATGLVAFAETGGTEAAEQNKADTFASGYPMLPEDATLGECFMYGLQVAGIGMAVVFLVLIIIMGILYIFKLVATAGEKKQAQTLAAPVASAPAAAPASVSDDEATVVAVATAAIAASRGASACAFKVISITKIQ